MDRLIDRGLEQLTAIIHKMGDVAEKVLLTSMRGFVSGKDTSKAVHELSEILTSMTTEVEEKAFELIVKYQPVASDLRIINSYIKIAYDFERYGRYAWDISSAHKRLSGEEKCPTWIATQITELSEKVLDIVKTANMALKNHDSDLAQSVAKKEGEIDQYYLRFLDGLVKEACATTQCTIANVLVARYLERVADHATYISESVVYIATGKKLTLR
ncbi:MAG: phosphate signaling complex protein PhoU [Candidatus Bathyarchaeota archaeon]|nr:phosphate signaling complex protein PhoU [Candidatus Bathyarchaeota archaeon]